MNLKINCRIAPLIVDYQIVNGAIAKFYCLFERILNHFVDKLHKNTAVLVRTVRR